MAKLDYYEINNVSGNAFADQIFKGNPAAVCPVKEWVTDEVLQHITAENNLPATVFYKVEPDGVEIRWFTT